MPDRKPELLNGLGEILDPAHTALVVIDMQNDFCAENGYIHTTQNVDMSGNKPLAARIGKLVEAARAAGAMVVWVKAISAYMDLLPVTKIQFEYFLCDTLDPRFTAQWYDQILQINPQCD